MAVDASLHACPCCGKRTLPERGHYDICDNCDWEDDPSQESSPDRGGGANVVSLEEARKNYAKYGVSDPVDCTR
ncbi:MULTISPECIES: CPCC family cysteine-rich protein [Polyangium]|uniref:Cysteine-rich CPCC domain-containing protein n=1 Tax=Polyangium fumosum TaxID=889272 RepID=A0A4U1IVW2_9BACT|nr:hypothetical protein E8A74_41735 [Polyangium fumosum]